MAFKGKSGWQRRRVPCPVSKSAPPGLLGPQPGVCALLRCPPRDSGVGRGRGQGSCQRRGPAPLLPLDGGASAHVIPDRLTPPRTGREADEPCGLRAEVAVGRPGRACSKGHPGFQRPCHFSPLERTLARSVSRLASDFPRCCFSGSFGACRSFHGRPSPL